MLLMIAGAVSAYNEQIIPVGVLAIGLFGMAYVVSMHFLLRD